MLSSLIQSHHIYSRELKNSQDTVFVDPIKRCECVRLLGKYSLIASHRLNSVYKQVELQAKQREQKLQVYTFCF